MASLLKGLLSSVFSYFDLWYTRKQSKSNEWAAKSKEAQMKSLEASRIQEGNIRDAVEKAETPESPSAWNKAAGIVLLTTCLFTPGCFEMQVYVNPRMPLVEVPARPTVPEEPQEWTEREKILAGYSTKLEAAIKAYNEEAVKSNKRNGFGE